MKIGITSFGLSQFPVDSIVAEYKQFVEANSKFKLTITTNKYAQLNPSEFEVVHYDPNDYSKICYFLTPSSISPASKSLLPSNVDVNIVLWNNQGYNVCWGGGTWGYGATVNGTLFVSIPFAWPLTTWGPWTYNYSQTLTHEWIHTVSEQLSKYGYTSLPNVDACGSYGFCSCDPCPSCTCPPSSGTGSPLPCNSPGWQNCFIYIFSTITNPMYQALGELPGGGGTGYTCTTSGCIPTSVGVGQYPDLASCNAVCVPQCTLPNAGFSYPTGSIPNCSATTSDPVEIRCDVQYNTGDIGKRYRLEFNVHFPSGVKSYTTTLVTINSTSITYSVPLSYFGTVEVGNYYLDHITVYDSIGTIYCAGSPYPTGTSCALVSLTTPLPPPVSCTISNASFSYQAGSILNCSATTIDALQIGCDVQYNTGDVGKQYKLSFGIHFPSGVKSYTTNLAAIDTISKTYSVPLSSFGIIEVGNYSIDHITVYDSAGNVYCSTYSAGLCTSINLVPGGYNCTATGCITPTTGTGQYPDLASCEAACIATKTYNCSGAPDYNCVEASTGTTGKYPDLASCEAVCNISPPPAPDICSHCLPDEICLSSIGIGCQKRVYLTTIGATALLLILLR